LGEAAWYLGNSTGWKIKRTIELRRGIALTIRWICIVSVWRFQN
jgi:hypothetical protein